MNAEQKKLISHCYNEMLERAEVEADSKHIPAVLKDFYDEMLAEQSLWLLRWEGFQDCGRIVGLFSSKQAANDHINYEISTNINQIDPNNYELIKLELGAN